MSKANALALFAALALAGGALFFANKVYLQRAASRALAPEAGRAVVETAFRALREGDGAPGPSDALDAPSGLEGPVTVFVSASDGGAAVVADGTGADLRTALRTALAHWRATPGAAPPGRVLWVKVHVVTGPAVRETLDESHGLARDADFALLQFPELGGLTLLPEQTLAYDVVRRVDQQDRVDVSELARFLEAQGRKPEGFAAWAKAPRHEVLQIPVEAWYEDERSGPVPTFRGHRLPPEVVGTADIDAAVDLAAAYLLGAARTDGSFVYNFQPKRNAPDGDYNILRHAGTIYAMMEMEAARPVPGLREKAEAAIGYLVSTFRPCPSPDPEALCVIEESATKLGGNALAVIALAKHAAVTGSRAHLGDMRRLAQRILSVQDPKTGEFTQHKQLFPGGESTTFTSDYYPGEAILALLRIHALDPDERWVEAAARAAHFLIGVRDAGKPPSKLDHDHWLLYGLAELWQVRRDPAFPEHAAKIVAAIAMDQNGRGTKALDWRGGWYDDPRTTPAATRTEGLMAAYRLFTATGDKGQADLALQTAREGARFLLGTQLREERVLYFSAPERALGGFPESLEGYEVRIDYVQHSISALLALRAALLGAAAPQGLTTGD